ncbi:MAG: lipopolysaccharide biosynthesis protein [Streptosporangiaceae bacterium]
MSTPLTIIRSSWERHHDLIRNVLTLLATTGVSLALGFGYWNIAARLFSQQAVGYGSAAISAMTFLSSFGTFGLNTLLIGALPKRTQRAGLIAAAMIAAALGSLVLAVAFVAIAPHFTENYDDVAGSLGGAAVFCCGVALTAAAVVFDAATIGMLRGGLQLTRNITFVVTKIVTLLGGALALHYTVGLGIFASWVAAIPVSLFVVAATFWIGGGALVLPRPDWTILRSLSRSLAAHNWLNLALQMPVLLTPVLAASILAPSTNAAYYVATTVVSGMLILPAHMSTVLFAMGSADPQALPGRLRFALRVSLLVGLVGLVILGLGAHLILGVFGAGYARIATLPMRIMVLASLPSIPNSLYIAVARATNKLSRAAALVTGFTILYFIAVVTGALNGGLVGMLVAALVVVTLEAVVTTPIVLQAARDVGRHRRAAENAASSALVGSQGRWFGGPASSPIAADHERQQLRALAVLMSLATPNTATMLAITGDSDQGSQSRRSKSDP